MKKQLSIVALAVLLCVPMTSCATIAGTAVSPITGGVDLCRQMGVSRGNWYMAPIYFAGGVVAGPFVAFYNGINHDAAIFQSFHRYWQDFDDVFSPFELIYSK